MLRSALTFLTAATFALHLSPHAHAVSVVLARKITSFGDLPNLKQFLENKSINKFWVGASNLNASFNSVASLFVGQRSTVNVTITSRPNSRGNYTLRTLTSDARVIKIISAPEFVFSYKKDELGSDMVVPVEFEGAYLGYSFIRFSIIKNENGTAQIERQEDNDILVSVVRPLGIENLITDVLLYVILVTSQLVMGTQIEMAVVKKAIKRPKALLVGLGCQFTIMPLLAYGITFLMSWRGGVATGFFALGCSPGGGMSNIYSALLGGETTLSVAMTLLSTLCALGFIPLWMFTLGTTLPADDGADALLIPFADVAITLAVTAGPLLVGLLIQYKLPRVTAFIRMVMGPVFLVFVLVAYALYMYTNSFVFSRFDVGTVLSSSALPVGGFLLAMFIAYALRLRWNVIKTVAIETGVQNGVVATIIVSASLPKPDSDLALIPVTASMLIGPSPLVLLCVFYAIYKKLAEKSKPPCLDSVENIERTLAPADVHRQAKQRAPATAAAEFMLLSAGGAPQNDGSAPGHVSHAESSFSADAEKKS